MNGRVEFEGWQGMDDKVRVMVVMDRACRDEAVGRAGERICMAEAFYSTWAPSLNPNP